MASISWRSRQAQAVALKGPSPVGGPTESAVLLRMTELDAGVRMPPLGRERADPAGIAAVRRFIESL